MALVKLCDSFVGQVCSFYCKIINVGKIFAHSILPHMEQMTWFSLKYLM